MFTEDSLGRANVEDLDTIGQFREYRRVVSHFSLHQNFRDLG